MVKTHMITLKNSEAILYRPVAVKSGNETTGDPAQDQICQHWHFVTRLTL